jgi:hypothetical protein
MRNEHCVRKQHAHQTLRAQAACAMQKDMRNEHACAAGCAMRKDMRNEQAGATSTATYRGRATASSMRNKHSNRHSNEHAGATRTAQQQAQQRACGVGNKHSTAQQQGATSTTAFVCVTQ